ncbi:MAG: hypothetical protein U1E77_04870 [Inhella sp.]
MSPPIHPDPPLPLGQGNLSALLAVAPALLPALLDAIPARVVVLDPQECLDPWEPGFLCLHRPAARGDPGLPDPARHRRAGLCELRPGA